MNIRVRRLLLNAIWLAGGNASSRVTTLAILVVAGRLLGPSEYGTFVAFQGLSLFIAGFAGFGLGTWTVRGLALGRDPSEVLDPSMMFASLAAVVILLASIVVW